MISHRLCLVYTTVCQSYYAAKPFTFW